VLVATASAALLLLILATTLAPRDRAAAQRLAMLAPHSVVPVSSVVDAGPALSLAAPRAAEAVRQDVAASFSPGFAAAAATLALALGALAGCLALGYRRQRAAVAALEAELAGREVAQERRPGKDAIYRAHYQNTTDSIFVMRVEEDGRFKIEDRNNAHRKDFGEGNIEGLELHDIMPADQAAYLTSFFRRCVETNAPIRYVVHFSSDKGDEFGVQRGDSHWETVLVPVHDDSGTITHLFGTSRDITDRVELEERLRQSQKMEALGQLTGGIAHDFNNLLTVVMGNLDLMKRAREDRKASLLDNAVQATERARELTQKLLVFGRRQSLKPEATDLRALVAGMDDMLMQSIRGDIGLAFDLPDDLWPVEVDQAQFQVALINLAANARDAMPRGGTLRVTARKTRLPGDEELDAVSIAIADTGHGMPRDVLARAFDPFFTTKEIGRGTGLGLAQVYAFAKQSGGSVEIESEIGFGTTVTIYLPRGKTLVAAPEATFRQPVERDRALEILLVEDNVQVAEVAGAILQEHGHSVATAHSADEALAMLEADHRFEFVFSDLVMPGGQDGLHLARTIRRRWPELPILLATGYSEAGERVAEEGLALLPKPYRASTLVATVQRVWAEAVSRGQVSGDPRGGAWDRHSEVF
jgi:PAS domain S-box-containing protein